MKKMLWVCIVVSMMFLLCACSGKTQGSDKTEDSGSSNKVHPIVGAWHFEDEQEIWTFQKNGTVVRYFFGEEDYAGVVTYKEESKYSVEGDILHLKDSYGERSGVYSISGKSLKLMNPEDMSIMNSAVCINEAAEKRSGITGKWQKIGVDGSGGFAAFDCEDIFFVTAYVKQFEFYKDGTYVAETAGYDRIEKIEWSSDRLHGIYHLVHNSQTIRFDNASYFDFKLLENGLLHLITPGGLEYLYAYQK